MTKVCMVNESSIAKNVRNSVQNAPKKLEMAAIFERSNVPACAVFLLCSSAYTTY